MDTLEEKKKALAETVRQIEKEFGKGSVMMLGERTSVDV
ncbi:MAG: hypothetical protein II510_07620, partial [Erysipelotrichales bacterium]|nr:hypothetical protein [Erysipelotrichales bacterium]